MSKHEYYEDALFNLLMEEVSDTMGEELLEESKSLNESEEADPPDSLLNSGYDTIDRELRNTKRRQRKVIAIKSFRAVSIAALLVLVIGVASYISFPQVRSHVQSFLLGDSDTGGSEAPGNAVSSGNAGRRFEDYKEVGRSYEYTENGIVETITYEDPETGDSFSVKVFTRYRDRSSDEESEAQSQERDSKGRLLITPPTPSPEEDDYFTYDPYNVRRPSTYYNTTPSSSGITPNTTGGFQYAINPNTSGPKPMVPGANANGQVGPSIRIFP